MRRPPSGAVCGPCARNDLKTCVWCAPAGNDRNELVCRVVVKPTKTAGFVELNFILVSTGGRF